MKKLFLVLFCILQVQNTTYAQKQTIRYDTLLVELTGKIYNRLNLKLSHMDLSVHIFKGKSVGNNKWMFIYPDSIYSAHFIADLLTSNKAKNIDISIYTKIKEDTLKMGSFGIPRSGVLSLVFMENRKYENNRSTSESESVDIFFCHNPDFEVYVPLYIPAYLMKKSYNEYILGLHKLIKQYQESHYLVSGIYGWINTIKTKQDVLMLHNSFSISAKNSYFGKKIKEHLNNIP
ncbi:MAG: hypothetical protein RSA75_01685 [Bacteroidales bacterium]